MRGEAMFKPNLYRICKMPHEIEKGFSLDPLACMSKDSAIRTFPSLTTALLAVLVAGALSLLVGCIATGPKYSEMSSTIPSLDPRLGRIFVYRAHNMLGSGTEPEVTLNEVSIGRTIAGCFFWVDRPPGRYTLRMKDWPDSSVTITLQAGWTQYIDYWERENPSAAEREAAIHRLRYAGGAEDPRTSAQQSLQELAESRAAEQERRNRSARDQQERQRIILEFTGTNAGAESADVFKLEPSHQISAKEINELLIVWKNRNLERLLRSTTEELRGHIDQIEVTILEATESAERERDEAQRLMASGGIGESQHTELARAYRLRIEVLKPILAAIKEEIANRSK